MDVVAFGFPLAGSPASGRDGYPAVSVNAGSITALRREEGRLKYIQLDAELNPGNSGGPVLDSRAKVIGVVRSGLVARGLGRTGINQAIPASAVRRFLARPEVQFTPPRLGPAELHKPVRFEARVTPLLPSATPLTVDLVLKVGTSPDRTARMEADGDRYRLTAVPIPGRAEPRNLRIVARFDNATLEATTTERLFKVSRRELSLGAVRSIYPGSPSRVVLQGGETIAGAVVGLNAVPTRLGGQDMSVDLASATEVTITPMGEMEKVACTLVVRQGESEVYRLSLSASDQGLLQNPGFELGVEGWLTVVSGTRPQITFDTSVVRQGRQALRVVANEPSDTAFGQDVQLKSGQWYRFSGWVRTRGLNPHASHVYGTFRIHDAAGSAIADGANHGADTEWNEVVLKFQARPGGLTRLCVFFVGFGKGTGTAWFDDLRLVEISGPLDN
jgi:hypothetical protein